MYYSGNFYLSNAQMEVNAQYIADIFKGYGWSKQAVCAMLGNMQTESTINPGIWQSFNSGNLSGGYGIVQWTPATKLFNWLDDRGLGHEDLDAQCARIQYELENGGQWQLRDGNTMSFSQYSVSTNDVGSLAQVFLSCYEGARDRPQPNRSTQAEYWYSFISWSGNSEVTKTELIALIEIANNEVVKTSTYTQASLNALQSAINNSQNVVDDVNATQSEVNQSYTLLQNAINNLELINSNVDKSDLISLIADANVEAGKTGVYTTESITNLVDAINSAQNVVDDVNATQSEVNQAYDMLHDALNALVKISVYYYISQTSFNLNRISNEQKELLQNLVLGDSIKIKFTYTRRKYDVGTNFSGKRLTIDDKNYNIISVEPNGLINIKYGSDGLIKKLNPNYVKEVSV